MFWGLGSLVCCGSPPAARPEQCGAGIAERRRSTWGPSSTWDSQPCPFSPGCWQLQKEHGCKVLSQQTTLHLNPPFADCELAKGTSLFFSDPLDCTYLIVLRENSVKVPRSRRFFWYHHGTGFVFALSAPRSSLQQQRFLLGKHTCLQRTGALGLCGRNSGCSGGFEGVRNAGPLFAKKRVFWGAKNSYSCASELRSDLFLALEALSWVRFIFLTSSN